MLCLEDSLHISELILCDYFPVHPLLPLRTAWAVTLLCGGLMWSHWCSWHTMQSLYRHFLVPMCQCLHIKTHVPGPISGYSYITEWGGGGGGPEWSSTDSLKTSELHVVPTKMFSLYRDVYTGGGMPGNGEQIRSSLTRRAVCQSTRREHSLLAPERGGDGMGAGGGDTHDGSKASVIPGWGRWCVFPFTCRQMTFKDINLDALQRTRRSREVPPSPPGLPP